MKPDTSGSLAPASGYLTNAIETLPEFQDNAMPKVKVVEFDPILDSSCMGPKDWVKIAEVVEEQYYNYDGFVVLHGTDTMAYTASALSFMFQHLGKPVVLTGSQIPFAQPYNDARQNLIAAAALATRRDLCEVCIFFDGKLLRGNRSKKVNNFDLAAFDSPNFPPLATLGVGVRLRPDLLLPPPTSRFEVHKNIDSRIVVVKLVPGFDDTALMAMVQHCEDIKAIVLETYGTGNMPSERAPFLDFVRAAKAKGVLVVVTTQCLKGAALLATYTVGRLLLDKGVLPALDMTTEAVVTKLAYLFGRCTDDLVEVREQFKNNLRGEVSPRERYTAKLAQQPKTF